MKKELGMRQQFVLFDCLTGQYHKSFLYFVLNDLYFTALYFYYCSLTKFYKLNFARIEYIEVIKNV